VAVDEGRVGDTCPLGADHLAAVLAVVALLPALEHHGLHVTTTKLRQQVPDAAHPCLLRLALAWRLTAERHRGHVQSMQLGELRQQLAPGGMPLIAEVPAQLTRSDVRPEEPSDPSVLMVGDDHRD
jgi:hypothetical protein